MEHQAQMVSYAKICQTYKKVFLKMYNANLFCEPVPTSLPKPDKNYMTKENEKPGSLISSDVKISNKILANRM